MFRRRPNKSLHKRPNCGLLVLLAAGLVAAETHGDEVAAYLERHGLDHLLAAHLEQQMEALAGDDRSALARRLVVIYAGLLESTKDTTLRQNLEQRSRRLLADAPADAGQSLRLALLRGAYRGAEKVAENHRLRQASPEEVEQAKATFTEIIPKLTRLRGQINERLRQTEQRLSRAGGPDAALLTERVNTIESLYTQATFVCGWALYYQSWLHERPDNARVAEELFAELLTAETQRPQPDDIPIDLRSDEAMARTILGMALCKSLTATPATALRWLELLSVPTTFQSLREALPVWRLVIHLEHGEFREAFDILADPERQETPLVWIRLAAVYALEAKENGRQAAELARLGVAMLAAKGELDAILDLADRYGADALGNRGFAFRYVRGAQHYDHARQEHGSQKPLTDRRIEALYDDAVNEFQAALAEQDVDRYPEAAASCQWLIGWCRFFQSRFLDARESFELAAGRLGPTETQEALWMAIVALDQAAQASGSNTHAQELADLITRVLDRYPSSPYGPKLRLKRALLTAEVSAEVVDDLLTIPADSDVYVAGRQRAAHLLYLLFRKESGERRNAYGNEYLAVALPLLAGEKEMFDVADEAALKKYLTRSRRVLEVALAAGIGRFTAAARVLDALDDLQRFEEVSLAQHRDEIDCRRVQERLAADDPAAAEAIADDLWARSPKSVWARLAERTLFRYGHDRWKSDRHGVSTDPLYLELVVRHGERVVAEFADDPAALSERRVLGYHAAVAEALMIGWQRRGNLDYAQRAVALYKRLLEAVPRDARFLRATAILSEELGDTEQALASWRTLVSGSPVGTERWYEARFHVVKLLAETDPARARAVLDQHKQLHPNYGPQPWAARLRQLDLRIPAAKDPDPGDPS